MSDDFSALLAHMQADFLDEFPERCNRLEEGVMALEQQEADAFDELYRQIHSLKGAGGMFGVPVITTICHQFESFISEARHGFDRKACDSALRYVDLLRKSGVDRDASAVAVIEEELEKLRTSSLSGRASVLLVEPSAAMRQLYQQIFSAQPVRLVTLESGLAALERMLHEHFDLMLASRELPDLNATALVAAVRESGCRNSDIPVILVSSNKAAVPAYLRITALVPRDTNLAANISRYAAELLARCSPYYRK